MVDMYNIYLSPKFPWRRIDKSVQGLKGSVSHPNASRWVTKCFWWRLENGFGEVVGFSSEQMVGRVQKEGTT